MVATGTSPFGSTPHTHRVLLPPRALPSVPRGSATSSLMPHSQQVHYKVREDSHCGPRPQIKSAVSPRSDVNKYSGVSDPVMLAAKSFVTCVIISGRRQVITPLTHNPRRRCLNVPFHAVWFIQGHVGLKGSLADKTTKETWLQAAYQSSQVDLSPSSALLNANQLPHNLMVHLTSGEAVRQVLLLSPGSPQEEEEEEEGMQPGRRTDTCVHCACCNHCARPLLATLTLQYARQII